MKQVKCESCGDKLEASTSRKVQQLQQEHWEETGHRRYRSIRGMGQTGLVMPVHPELGHVDDSSEESWEAPPEAEPEAITEPELRAALAAYATKRDLAAMNKNIATRHDMEALRIEVGQRLKSVQPDVTLRAEVENAMKKALERLQKVEGTESRVRALEDWKRNTGDLLKRLKRIERDGAPAQDPRVPQLVADMGQLLKRQEQQRIANNDLWQIMETLARRVDFKMRKGSNGLTKMLIDGEGFETRPHDENVLVTTPTEGAAQILGLEEQEPAQSAPEASEGTRPDVPEACLMARTFVAGMAHRLRLNRYEAAKWLVDNLGVPERYASGLITVGLMERWLETRKAPATGHGGAGQPKKVLHGSAQEERWMRQHAVELPWYEKLEAMVKEQEDEMEVEA